MSHSILVIILKGETKQGDGHIKRLKLQFSESCFTFHVLDCESLDDTIRYQLALKYAKHEYKSFHCLIMKDSSLIMIDDIKKYIDDAIKLQTDLFFLCKYQDACHQYTRVEHYHHLKKTYSSTATQAIMFNPKARDIMIKQLSNQSIGDVLYNQLNKNHLSGLVTIPNIVHFDINLASSNDDYYKLNECALIKSDVIETTDSTNITWMVLIIILILFLVLIVPYYKHYRQLL